MSSGCPESYSQLPGTYETNVTETASSGINEGMFRMCFEPEIVPLSDPESAAISAVDAGDRRNIAGSELLVGWLLQRPQRALTPRSAPGFGALKV